MKSKSICLNMIVKDESRVIRRCLASVQSIIDHWVIIDTGSTDGTQEIIREFLKDIPGELHERPWVNFEHNRNEALDLARNKTEYVLFIDADEILSINSFNKKSLVHDAYFFEVICEINFSRVCLVKNHPDLKWKGVVHEYLSKWGEHVRCHPLPGMAIDCRTPEGQPQKGEREFREEIAILEQAIKIDPENSSRYMFFLAQTHACLDNWAIALDYYKKRVEMGGSHTEQVFWSLYCIGAYQQNLKEPSETFLASYSRAYQYYPSRAEPLYRMAVYFSQTKNYTGAYYLAKVALAIPKPAVGFTMESWIYDYGLSLLLAQCANELGKKQEAQKICQQLLRMNLPKETELSVRGVSEACRA